VLLLFGGGVLLLSRRRSVINDDDDEDNLNLNHRTKYIMKNTNIKYNFILRRNRCVGGVDF